MSIFKKKIFSLIIVASFLSVVILPKMVYAEEKECSENHVHMSAYNSGENIEWIQEVTVEVSSEEEFLKYPKNPNYKYTFVITSPSLTRAICYNCGRPNMSTVTYKEQATVEAKMCPTNNWGNDIFASWNNYSYERCTACGFEGETWLAQITYTATCLNGDNPVGGGDWVVSYDFTQNAGYNPHQSLRWWTEYSYI